MDRAIARTWGKPRIFRILSGKSQLVLKTQDRRRGRFAGTERKIARNQAKCRTQAVDSNFHSELAAWNFARCGGSEMGAPCLDKQVGRR